MRLWGHVTINTDTLSRGRPDAKHSYSHASACHFFASALPTAPRLSSARAIHSLRRGCHLCCRGRGFGLRLVTRREPLLVVLKGSPMLSGVSGLRDSIISLCCLITAMSSAVRRLTVLSYLGSAPAARSILTISMRLLVAALHVHVLPYAATLTPPSNPLGLR